MSTVKQGKCFALFPCSVGSVEIDVHLRLAGYLHTLSGVRDAT
jgi:hypothetical protein